MVTLSAARAALLALVASSLSSAMPTIMQDLPQPEDLPESQAPQAEAAAPINSSAIADAPLVMNKISMGFPYGQEKVRGVNLGGWLVLEPWITPTLFSRTGNPGIIDEWTFGQYQDRNTALNALQNHWNTWITENDFAQIKAAGLNHVRLPVGYWSFDLGAGEPYIQGAAPYVDKAITWARNHGLKVLLELHGAPGSQNGYDNSGHRGDANFANNQNNALRAKNVLNKLAQKYAYSDVVTALGLLNEPATYISTQLLDYTTQYWRDAYGATRWPWAQDGNGAQSNLLLVISDGFQPLSHWNGFMSEPGYTSVAIDTHYYQVFSNEEVAWDWNTHLQQVCSKQNAYRNAPNWLFVGEWSLASTDCAPALNGRGRGARYDGTMPGSPRIGSCSDKTGSGNNFSPEYKEFMRKFYDTQTQVYENNGQGWFYWTWKAENAADWSYQRGMELGYIPRNPTDHKYPLNTICG